MRIDIVTIFPEMFHRVFDHGVVGRARRNGNVRIHLHDLRDWTKDRHRSTDDAPYGGGPGMVMKIEPLVEAVEAIASEGSEGSRRIVLLSPRGTPLRQAMISRLVACERLVLVAGRYEGVDERFREAVGAEEISIGDYVLSGGEIPAMVVVDAVVRLLPGTVSDPRSAQEDSFSAGLLDHPHYTRPAEFRGLRVPEVLLSGNHAAVRDWRQRRALEDTKLRRPELLTNGDL
ncbi:MAG TPA: tRNA (guanosine(37)-N1)-methyltransferase TrmD [Vicinamibacteria bacterium]|nr:tRNA (guanosine(37)-N1)-methyltransferase TrmD [Vicinamibacteria bacterium]